MIIQHITAASTWQAALEAGSYRPDSFTADGFIHCSTPAQVIPVANRFYRGVPGLVLLHIDPLQVQAEIKFENLEGGAELFPHIYGPLNLEAVVKVTTFEPGEDGVFH